MTSESYPGTIIKRNIVIKEEIDNHKGGIVKITLDGKIRDKEFARLVISEKDISRIELFLLQKIAS